MVTLSMFSKVAHAAVDETVWLVRHLPGAPLCQHDWSLPFAVNFGRDGNPGAWVTVCNRCGRYLRDY